MSGTFLLAIIGVIIILLLLALVVILLANKKKQRPTIPPMAPPQELPPHSLDRGIDHATVPPNPHINSVDTPEYSIPVDQLPATHAPTNSAAAQTSLNSMDIAERLIAEQRYDEAGIELKRLLMTNPKNTQAMLKLLQLYGIVNNYSAFGKLYEQIRSIGEPEVVSQAEKYYALIADDIANAEAATRPKHVEPVIETLEFDLGDDTSASSELIIDESTNDEDAFVLSLDDEEVSTVDTTVNGVSIDEHLIDIGLDDFGSDGASAQNLDTQAGQTQIASAQSSAEQALAPTDDLSSQFDDLLLDDTFGNTGSATDTSFEDALDSDLSMDLGTDLRTDLNMDALAEDTNVPDSDFDFDSLALDTPSLAQTSIIESQHDPAQALVSGGTPSDEFDINNLDIDDFANDFDSPLDNAPTPSDASTQTNLGIGDFDLETKLASNFSADMAVDLDLSADFDTSPTTKTALNHTAFNEPGFDDRVNQHNFTQGDVSQGGINQDAVKQKVTDKLDLGTLDLTPPTAEPEPIASFDADTTSVQPKAETSVEFDLKTDLDREFTASGTSSVEQVIEFELPTTEPTPVSTQAIEDDFGADLDLGDLGVTAPSTAESAPQVALSSHLDSKPAPSNTFGAQPENFGAQLDNAEIALTLANKYLSLGEQDGAKRLLNEVIADGNPAQKQAAQSLLARIS